MEDSGIVSKKFIAFIGLIILGLFIFWIIYALDKENKPNTNPTTKVDEVINTETDTSSIDESFMYGKFVNELDPYSYLVITKDSYTYVMNVCEGYVTYKDTDFVFDKNITQENGVNSVTIKLTSNTNEVVNMTFTGSSKDKIDVFTSSPTCSGSDKYIKTLED